MIKHEDERRLLIDFGGANAVKVIYAKEGCVVGNHYHKNKDENFTLLSGEGAAEVGDEASQMKIGEIYHCPRGTRHTFTLMKGSIMLGTATEPFDPEDEYA